MATTSNPTPTGQLHSPRIGNKHHHTEAIQSNRHAILLDTRQRRTRAVCIVLGTSSTQQSRLHDQASLASTSQSNAANILVHTNMNNLHTITNLRGYVDIRITNPDTETDHLSTQARLEGWRAYISNPTLKRTPAEAPKRHFVTLARQNRRAPKEPT